jgi:hypothetical protein
MAEQEEIQTKVIVEVVGTPKEHVEDALKIVLDNIKKEAGITPDKMKVFRPKPIDNYFSAFAELDLRFDSAGTLIGFCFDYMPSSVEIVRPEDMSIGSVEMGGLLNDLLSKLHNVNMAVTQLKAENDNLKNNAEGLLKNIIMLSIREKPKDIDQIARDLGIKAADLKPFVEKYVGEDRIEEKDGLYKLKGSLY